MDDFLRSKVNHLSQFNYVVHYNWPLGEQCFVIKLKNKSNKQNIMTTYFWQTMAKVFILCANAP